MQVDMHIHTVESDGTFTPEEIIKRGLKNNVTAIAITDHDTVVGIEEGIKFSNELGMEFIPGIEISCNEENLEVHILGYYLNLDDAKFIREIDELKKERETRNFKIIENFKKIGIIIDEEKLKKNAPGNIISRLHFAKYLVSEGIVKSKDEAFIRYLGKNGLAYEPKENFPPERAVKIISDNGGFVSLAHPFLITPDVDLLDKLIERLKPYGLDALEAQYSSFSKTQIKSLKRIAKKHGLIITGGSDFHGSNRTGIDIGCGGLEYQQLELIKEKLKLKKEERV